MRWTADLTYAIGLIATDGSLSKDGRHIDLTSKDIEQIKTFACIFNLKNKIGLKSSSYLKEKKYYRIQFGNVKLYNFLLKIGITPNKSKTLRELKIPPQYFCDYLRGYLDGDGCTFSYYDKRWKNSFRLYTAFISASFDHLKWLQETIKNLYDIEGKIGRLVRGGYQLRFAKNSSIKLFKILYYTNRVVCLKRKKFKVDQALSIIRKQAGMAKLVNAQS